MKNNFHLRLLFVLVWTVAPLWMCKAQTNFFTDTFNRGSIIDSTNVPPTTNSTSYEVCSAKPWGTIPSLSPRDMQFGISNTGGGVDEVQAFFATNPVVLSAIGTDYIQMTVVFTNTSDLLISGQGYLGFGLYNTAGATNYPVPGGLNGTATSSFTTNVTGYVQNWVGYVGQIGYPSFKSQIMTRAAQGGAGNNNQDLISEGSTSQSYSTPPYTAVGTAITTSPALTAGETLTEVLTIMLNGLDSLAITNTLYSGPNTNGAILTQFGGVATNTSYLIGSFNGFALGFYQKTELAAPSSNILDVSSIVISGLSSTVSSAPVITAQPAPVLVATNGSCAFSATASGFGLSYQWHRNGTNLVDGGNISGSTSDLLVISPAGTADQLSGNNGYYLTVTGTGGYYTNSVTNSLALITATNLIWEDNDSDQWDVNATPNWDDTNGNEDVFNFGDPVVFNDAGFGGSVELLGSYLSAASVTMDSTNYVYTFENSPSGPGSFAGPGSLFYTGPAEFIISNANTFTGGTLISNSAAYLDLQNNAGLGTGPVTLGEAGGRMEITTAGNANSGIEGNVIVADNFTILVDPTNNSYSGVFLGDLSGTSGKTLTITNGTANPGGFYRVRTYGNDTTYDANLNLANSAILFAAYSSSGSQTYNGVISGSGQFMEKGTTTYLNGPNTYSGGTTPAQGAIGLGISSVGNPVTSGPIGTGPLFVAPDSTTSVTGNGMIFASASNIAITNAIQYPSGTNNLTLQVGGTNNLTLSGAFTLQGNDDLKTNTITSRIIQVTNSALTTISGVVSDGGLGYGLNQTGNGVLALNNNETYTGPTTNSAGTLLVNGQFASDNVVIATNATLGGTGVISGPVTIQSGGTLTAGNQAIAGNQGIGTLTINNTLTFQAASTNFVQVNQSLGTHDLITGLTSVAYDGTLNAANVAGTLAVGNTFNIFSAAAHLGNFSTITGSAGPGLAWSFNPTNGVLSVITGVNANPTNITFSVSGGNLTLSWPSDHTGWQLQAQTNTLAVGISTNWSNVSGSTTTNQVTIPVNLTKGCIFYRLVY